MTLRVLFVSAFLVMTAALPQLSEKPEARIILKGKDPNGLYRVSVVRSGREQMIDRWFVTEGEAIKAAKEKCQKD